MNQNASKWLGLTPYEMGLNYQYSCHEGVIVGSTSGVIIGCEHPRVLTRGRRSKNDPKPTDLTLPVFDIGRGGHQVFHEPGQLVIYPILRLRSLNLGVRDYVQRLVQCTNGTLAEFGIQSELRDEPGLFTQRGKIAFFGVQIRRGVSLHGLAINVTNDLEEMKTYELCRARNLSLDRVLQYCDASTEEVFMAWVRHWRQMS